MKQLSTKETKNFKENKEIPPNTRILTVEKEVRIPSTDIILEKGDKIKVFSQAITDKKKEKNNKKKNVIKEQNVDLWKDKISSAKGSITVGREEYEMDEWGTYKNNPPSNSVLDLFDNYQESEKWFKSAGLDYIIEESGLEPDDYPNAIMNELSDYGIVEKDFITDNTYNWQWLGPWDVVFSTAKSELTNEYITFFAIHQGGDVRGNYGPTYVYEDSYESGFFEKLINIFASITIEFKDGGVVLASSNQDSDIWYFEVNVDKKSELANEFKEYCKNIGQGFELDEFLTDFLA